MCPANQDTVASGAFVNILPDIVYVSQPEAVLTEM